MKKMFVIKNLSTGQFLCGTSSFDELQRAALFGTRENAENHIESFRGELDGEILEIIEIFVHEDYF
jgi:hypothetical protein